MPEQNRYPRPPLVLIVTGEEWLSLSVETLFSPRGYAALRAYTAAQALDRIRQTSPDLVVISKDLRDTRGIDLCRAIHEEATAGETTPVILIAPGTWTRVEKMEVLRAGAWDAVSFPIDGEELFLRVDNWVRAKIAADLAREQGLLDASTGFYNAHGLLKRIAEVAAGAGRHGRALACVIISGEALDASVEEGLSGGGARSRGSATSLAEYLREAGRASDAIGRLGENEFVVVAPDTDVQGALGLAQRLKNGIETASAGSTPVHLRFGCYAVPDFRAASIAPTEMLLRAGQALRAADAELHPIRIFERYPDTLN